MREDLLFSCMVHKELSLTKNIIYYCLCEYVFFREFQPMASALNDSSLSSDQDTNQFLM